jgi:hypothetical protein
MAHATLRGRVWGRSASLLGGGLIAALLVSVATIGSAQQPKDKKDDKKDDKKGKVDTGLTAPPPLNLTIVGKDPKDAETTAEMVKLINEKLAEGWTANKVVQSRWADDHEYIRRATLDIIGRVATVKEIEAYMKQPAATRRSWLIEQLLASDEYPRHWADSWSNWLLSRSGIFGSGRYHEELKKWLEDEFAQNKPYSDIVYKLITAAGKNDENGSVNFILAHLGERTPMPRKGEDGEFEMVPITSRITRIFLGTQVQCAQCHDHPFQNAIKQHHFWGVNAYLRQVDRKGNIPMRRQDGLMTLELVDNTNVNQVAKVFFEKRNGLILEQKAEFLPQADEKYGAKMPKDAKGIDRRKELANAVIGHENFPKAIVNRMWGTFLGRGFINPIDDFNDQNQPSNPELFNELASRFKQYNYDLKKLIRWITHSNAYNLSYVANSTNDKPEHEVLFSRYVMKSMSPEQLFESLVTATGSEEKGEDKKKARDEWMNKLVANFGDDEGNEVNFNGTVVQALMMMNGNELNGALDKGKGTLGDAMKKGAPKAIITELYLATLNRPPSDRELASVLQKMALRPGFKDKDPSAPFQDLFWALCNCNEFLLNH